MAQKVYSENPVLQLEGTTRFRKLLSNVPRCLIEEILGAGVLPRFVEFLDKHDLPQLQLEAAWVLTNIASGNSQDTLMVINNGAVPKLVKLLDSPDDDVREQAAWALGNIAGDSSYCRDIVLCDGALMPLLAQLNEHSKQSILRIVTWTLSNIFRGIPPPRYDQVKPALLSLKHLLYSGDAEVLSDACWCLSYLSKGAYEQIQGLIEAGVCPRLVELLNHPSIIVLQRALRTVGNIVAGNSSQTQAVIEANIIPPLVYLLQHGEFEVKMEAAWAISNAITRGSREQVWYVLVYPPYFIREYFCRFMIHARIVWFLFGSFEILEANLVLVVSSKIFLALLNLTSRPMMFRFLVSKGCIMPLCCLLGCSVARTVTVCLESLDKILKVGDADKEAGKTPFNVYLELINECNGMERVEYLQCYDNDDIYDKAVKILDRYWEEDKDYEQDVQDGANRNFEGKDDEQSIQDGASKNLEDKNDKQHAQDCASKIFEDKNSEQGVSDGANKNFEDKNNEQDVQNGTNKNSEDKHDEQGGVQDGANKNSEDKDDQQDNQDGVEQVLQRQRS